jgi:acid phosphatase (class A)
MKRAIRFLPQVLLLLMLATAPRVWGAFVQASDFDFKALLPAPPDATQTQAEVEQLLKLQAQRTDADVKRIKTESKMTAFIFSDALGSWFNPDDLPVTAAFLTKVMGDAHDVVGAAKDVYERKRPFLTDDRIKPCAENEKTYSYPSSHSTRAMVIAMTLAELLPDHKEAVMAEGMRIGDDRALAGQHFPSDVAAGRILAKAIFDKMKQDPKFSKELAAAKAECAQKEPVKQAAN